MRRRVTSVTDVGAHAQSAGTDRAAPRWTLGSGVRVALDDAPLLDHAAAAVAAPERCGEERDDQADDADDDEDHADRRQRDARHRVRYREAEYRAERDQEE